MASVIEKFDDDDREMAQALLEQYWVIREEQPDLYQRLRKREQALRNYFFDKCGFRLLVTRQFIKLEKIPASSAAWMGLPGLQQVRDYTLLCCLLAFLESKSLDEQFLLSDLCEALLSLYPETAPEQDGIRWESYECRKALVRVLELACAYRLLVKVDGDVAGFGGNRESEALFEVTLLTRYFLRSYPKDLQQYATMSQLLAAEDVEEESDVGRVRKQRIYRELYLTPGYERRGAGSSDFLYLRNMRNRLAEDISEHSLLRFELYKEVAMLTVPAERRYQMQAFPDRSGLAAVMLHLGSAMRQRWREADGAVKFSFTDLEFDQLLEECRQRTGAGWTKEYRDMPMAKLKRELLAALVDWKMACVDEEAGFIWLTPLLGRTIGAYPEDYKPEKKSKNGTELKKSEAAL